MKKVVYAYEIMCKDAVDKKDVEGKKMMETLADVSMVIVFHGKI